MKVGEYIRTNRGTIGKINRIIEEKEKVAEETLYELYLQKNEYYLATFNEIVKHSKNIIDLIEERRFCKWASYRGNTRVAR